MSLLAFSPSISTSVQPTTVQAEVTVGGVGNYLRFVNAGPGNAFVLFYEGSQTPPTVTNANSMMIIGGAIEIFSVGSYTTRISVLGDAQGCFLNVTRGTGM